mgnify:CR=1 FL=1
MRLISCLVDYIKAILICKFEITVDWWIMRCPYCIEAKLLEYLHIFPYDIFRDDMACRRMLHVRTLGVYLQRYSVEIEDSVDYLGLLEADTFGDLVHNIACIIRKDEGHVIEVRSLRSPFVR